MINELMNIKHIKILIIIILVVFSNSCINQGNDKSTNNQVNDSEPPPPKPGECYDYDLKNTKFSQDTIKQIEILAENAKSIITENDIYELVNQTIFPTNEKKIADSLCQKIVQKTRTYYGHIDLKRLTQFYPKYIKQDDILFMYSQLSCNEFYWKSDNLKNAICLTDDELHKIFARQKGDTTNNSSDKWKTFRQKYGLYGLHSYSKPIFNKQKDFALIETSGSGGEGLGSGNLLIFQKINSKWKLIESIELWIT